MGSELPRVPGGSRRVLYPASVKASTDLQVAGVMVWGQEGYYVFWGGGSCSCRTE